MTAFEFERDEFFGALTELTLVQVRDGIDIPHVNAHAKLR